MTGFSSSRTIEALQCAGRVRGSLQPSVESHGNVGALDTSLSRLDPAELARFTQSIPHDALGESDPGDRLVHPDRARHPVDRRSMSWIPEGVYLSGPLDQPVWLPGFWLDTYPVTNSDYLTFVTATAHPPPRHWREGRPPAQIAGHPVVWITHDDADAYARWAHKQLPTAEQWEKAVRGTTGSTWPWGDQVTPAKCNCKTKDRSGATTPVDRYKSSVSCYGVYDLCGNAWEWTSTPSAPGRYELKGSSFNSLLDNARPAAFNDAHHTMLDDDTGFRCATTDLNT
jgi:hypothetical protein